MSATAENVAATLQDLVRQAGIHVARHSRLHPLFGADVLDHDQGPELVLAVADQRQDCRSQL